jgi:hypothetical protein
VSKTRCKWSLVPIRLGGVTRFQAGVAIEAIQAVWIDVLQVLPRAAVGLAPRYGPLRDLGQAETRLKEGLSEIGEESLEGTAGSYGPTMQLRDRRERSFAGA